MSHRIKTPAYNRWCWLQANRDVSGEMLQLAARLGRSSTAADEWAAGVLAGSGSKNPAQVLRAVWLAVLAEQLASPGAATAKPLLTLGEIRKLASGALPAKAGKPTGQVPHNALPPTGALPSAQDPAVVALVPQARSLIGGSNTPLAIVDAMVRNLLADPQFNPTGKTSAADRQAAAQALATAAFKQAKVDAANRMQSNPYQPGVSMNNARQRMGSAFNQNDYNAGSTTPRISQDPPEFSASSAGLAFQDIGDTYFRGENLSLNYNGKPVDHVAFAGKNLSVKDIARLSRAPDGSTINVTSHAMLRDQLSIEVSNSGVFNRPASTELWRSQGSGEIFVKNMMFDSQSKAPAGFGLQALWEQAKAARAIGVKSIQSDAFSSGTKPPNTQYVGPYVWGKYGFDAALPHAVRDSIQAPNEVTTVAQLYSDPALAARWKDYVLNHSFHVTMHLDPNGSGFDRLSNLIDARRATRASNPNPK